eukprot:6700822-Pyramimonas_sp.AAC.1
MARSNLNLRSTSLRWTPQQPSKVATLSQNAAPLGCRGFISVRVACRSAGPPSSSRKWRHVRRSQPTGMVRSNTSLRGTSLRWIPHRRSKVATLSQTAAPQGWPGRRQAGKQEGAR